MGIDGLLFPNRCTISKRPEPRCLTLVAAVLIFGGVATGSRAEDLGTVGQTYAIAEPHLLNYIEQTLREKERSGELANLEEQAKMNWYAYCAGGSDHPRIPDDQIEEMTARPAVFELPHFADSAAQRRQGGEGGVWAYYSWKVSRDL